MELVNMGQLLVLLIVIASSAASPREKRLIPSYTSPTGRIMWYEIADNYPEEDANNFLDELEKQTNIDFFSSQQINNMINRYREINKNITYENLCSTNKRRLFPRLVEIDNTKYFVLNPWSRFVQYIDTEVCNSSPVPEVGDENQACLLVVSAGLGYSTKCVQEYITRTLYVRAVDGHKKFFAKPIEIESCCSCGIRYY